MRNKHGLHFTSPLFAITIRVDFLITHCTKIQRLGGIITSSVEPPVVVALVVVEFSLRMSPRTSNRNTHVNRDIKVEEQRSSTSTRHFFTPYRLPMFSHFTPSSQVHIHILVSLDFFFKPAIFKGACHGMLNVVGHDEN